MRSLRKRRDSHCWLAGGFMGLAMSLASHAHAEPLIILPGESVDDIELEELVLREDKSSGAGNAALGDVQRGGQGDNKIQLKAEASECTLDALIAGMCNKLGRTTAVAKAEFRFEFCVPEVGAIDCDTPPGGDNEDLTTTISLDILRIGQFITILTGSAEFEITARVRDLERGKNVGFQQVENLSQGGGIGNIKVFTIYKVPVPIPVPEFDNPEIVDKTVFTVQVRRGNVHRLSVFATARAKSGVKGAGGAIFNDDLSLDPLPLPFSGRVAVRDLSIYVSPSTTDQLADQGERIVALEETLVGLGERLSALTETQSDLLDGVQQDVSDLAVELEELFQGSESVQGEVDALRLQFNNHSHDCLLLRPQGVEEEDDDDGSLNLVIACGPPTR